MMTLANTRQARPKTIVKPLLCLVKKRWATFWTQVSWHKIYWKGWIATCVALPTKAIYPIINNNKLYPPRYQIYGFRGFNWFMFNLPIQNENEINICNHWLFNAHSLATGLVKNLFIHSFIHSFIYSPLPQSCTFISCWHLDVSSWCQSHNLSDRNL